MKTEQVIKETLKIPNDLIIEVLAIIVQQEIKHEVINVVQNRSIIILEIFFEASHSRKQKALNTIQGFLSQYNEYRAWEHEEVNWKED